MTAERSRPVARLTECSASLFYFVPRLLDGPVPLLATVAMNGGGLIAEAKARPDVRLVEVTEATRDGLPAELERWAGEHARRG